MLGSCAASAPELNNSHEPPTGRPVPSDFQFGEHVEITFGLFRDRGGVIRGQATRPWRDTWLVELDQPRLGFKRLRVAQRALRHAQPAR